MALPLLGMGVEGCMLKASRSQRSRICSLGLGLLALLGSSSSAMAANSITIVERSGVTTASYPVQIGRPFVQGEIPHFPQAVVGGQPLLTQADVKSRWPDGSVKHAILSFVLPVL